METLKKSALFFFIFFNSIVAIAQSENRDQFEKIQSTTLKTAQLSQILQEALVNFSEQKYQRLKPYILEKNILQIQNAIHLGKFSYQELTQFYLYRISKFETNANTSLHTIISLNPNILEEAKEKDLQLKNKKVKHQIFGMPILLKDNIGSKNMNTTAGALALSENQVDDSFVVKRLKANGALILGKVNLSEWAYYLCEKCPSGYSAVGGHTLNPYGPGKFDTGGSSSGSAVSVAANYAVAAVGTETAGSILSPSSQNSVVGLKPTVGVLSRSGIIPLSSSFDTPGPITKNVVDNSIVLSAMLGKDETDPSSVKVEGLDDYKYTLNRSSLKEKRFGVIQSYLKNPLYAQAIEKIKNMGGIPVVISPKVEGISVEDFKAVLNNDFKNDLANYLKNYGSKNVEVKSLNDLIIFNLKHPSARIPYGQGILEAALKDSTSALKLKEIKNRLAENSEHYFQNIFNKHHLDAVLSINNYNAFEAAIAKYPALCVPMGYSLNGEPMSLTFIVKPLQERKLFLYATAYESMAPHRKVPEKYN